MNKLFALAAAIAVTSPALAQSFPTGLQGIKIAVADYERATRFYAILGLAPGVKYNPLEWQLRWLDPAKGAPIIMVNDPNGRIKVPTGGAFLMISVTDVPATVARLKQAGFAADGEVHAVPQATMMMIKDPDGNSVELLGPPARAAGANAKPTEHDHAH